MIVEKVKAEKVATRGFDAESLEFVDMIQAGIIDPTKVERVALQNAASVASLLLTTEALICDLPEEKPAAAPADAARGHVLDPTRSGGITGTAPVHAAGAVPFCPRLDDFPALSYCRRRASCLVGPPLVT